MQQTTKHIQMSQRTVSILDAEPDKPVDLKTKIKNAAMVVAIFLMAAFLLCIPLLRVYL